MKDDILQNLVEYMDGTHYFAVCQIEILSTLRFLDYGEETLRCSMMHHVDLFLGFWYVHDMSYDAYDVGFAGRSSP